MFENQERKEKRETPSRLILLFDIDWTLLVGGNKAQYDSFDYAIKEVYGVNGSIREIIPHGMIDTQVIIEVLKLHSVSEEKAKERIGQAIKAMERYFIQHEDEGKCIPMPGSKVILELLEEKGIKMGLLTGNIKPIALRKLEKTGLKDFFSFGAFGNMAFRRVDLIDVARQEAEKFGMFEHELVIVGDSPLDIATAKIGGLRSIAVGAGPYKVHELKASKPDLVVNSLEDTSSILKFLKPA